MRAQRPSLNVKDGFFFLLLFSCLTQGCTVGKYDVNYPESWSPRVVEEPGPCPIIAGHYLNKGERHLSSIGPDCYSNCGALISELKDGNKVLSWHNIGDKERIKDRIIEIRQSPTITVDIIEWKETDGEYSIMSEVQLSQENGDFSCEDGSVQLKTRIHTVLLLLGNAIVTETRAFSKAEDGALVMKRFTKAGGHNFIFPEAYGIGEWVRWPSVELLPIKQLEATGREKQ